MPSSIYEAYFPVLAQILLAVTIAAALIALGVILGKRVRNRVKDTPYECGIPPTGGARERFSVKFYLVAMLFILFDIEAIFFYPWAVVYKDLKLFGFILMAIFIEVVLTGFWFVWRKGVLDWAYGEEQKEPRQS